MATLKLTLQNGFFTGTQGCQYVYEKTPTHVVANNWDCRIKEDGSVECNTKKLYSSGEYSMRYTIQKNGFAKLTLKEPGKRVETLRKGFVVPKGKELSDGLIGLSGGPINKRYAYFRDGSFQKFLNELGISAVKHVDPNKTYTIRNAWYGGGECTASLTTDGETTKVDTDYGRTDRWEESSPGGTSASECNTEVEVTGATWAIHAQSQHEGDSHNCFRILYTLEKDPTKLAGLLELQQKEAKISQLYEFGKKGFGSIADLEKALLELIPNLRFVHNRNDAQNFSIKTFFEGGKQIYTNSIVQIDFSSAEEAKKAFSLLKNKFFKDTVELDKSLKDLGFSNYKLPKYFASVHREKRCPYSIYVDVLASTTEGLGNPIGRYTDWYEADL